MKHLTIVLLSVLSMQGCIHNEPIEEPGFPIIPFEFTHELIFGDFYPLCLEDCINIYKINKSGIYKAETDVYPLPLENYELPTDYKETVKNSKYDRVALLLHGLPIATYMQESTVYSNPDNGDQGGLILSFEEGQQRKILILDYFTDQIPEELREYAGKIKEAIAIMKE